MFLGPTDCSAADALVIDGSNSVCMAGTAYGGLAGITGDVPLHDPSGGEEIFILKLISF